MVSYKRPATADIIGTVDDAANNLQVLSDELKSKASKYQMSLQHMIDLFTAEHQLGLDDTKRYVNFDAKSPKPADIMFRVMGMLSSPPKCEYIAPAGTNKARDIAELIEKHVNAVYPWLRRKYKVNFNLHGLFWQLLAGRSYLQQTYLPNYWAKEEFERRDGEKEEDEGGDTRYNTRIAGYRGHMGPPVFVECLDPRAVYPIRTPMGPRAWVKEYRVQRFVAERAFRERGKKLKFVKDPQTGKWGAYNTQELNEPAGKVMPVDARGSETETVVYHEYIDKRYCYYVVGGRVVHEYKHDGGIGIFEAQGLQTGFSEEDLMAVGILWAVRNAIPQYDFFRTLWAQRAYLDVFPQLAAQLGPGEHPIQADEGGDMVWKIEPQTIIQVRGQLTNVLADSASGEDFRAAVEMLGGDIDLATITQLARGLAGAQQPGYSINQLSQAMRSVWGPIIESREEQHGDMYGHYLWILKNKVKRPTTVFGDDGKQDDRGRKSGDYLTIHPETDIDDFYFIRADLEPELPIDKQGNMQVWMKAGETGWATEEEVSRYGFDAANPRERMRQIRSEQARRAFMPEAIKDAMTLGRVKLTAEVAKAQGSDRLNTMFQQNPDEAAAADKIGSTPQPPGGGQEGGGAGPVVPGATTPPMGIPETSGANPAQPFPGPRMGGQVTTS